MSTTETPATALNAGPANPGVSSEQREAWLDQRRGGCTATEIAQLAKGSTADRRRIIREKLTGERQDLSGNKYVERGNEREPVIMAWVEENFDLAPSSLLYAGTDPRHLATPDGVSNLFFIDGLTAEVKTSKHNMDPALAHFKGSGYMDQMQWQMHVMGGQRVLFVWEQHDDNWPDPKPVHDEPQWRWIDRDQKRIDELVAIADDFLRSLDHARPEGLAPVGDIPAEMAQLAHEILQHRNTEAAAKVLREAAWKKLQALNEGVTEFAAENDQARISISTVQKDADVLDEALMRERAPRAVEQYEALVKRYTKRKPLPPKTTLTVTAKKAAVK